MSLDFIDNNALDAMNIYHGNHRLVAAMSMLLEEKANSQ
jgi:hypothetical protein